MPKPFKIQLIKTRKKLCSQIIYEKTEMRALCSKTKNHVFFILSFGWVLEKGHL